MVYIAEYNDFHKDVHFIKLRNRRQAISNQETTTVHVLSPPSNTTSEATNPSPQFPVFESSHKYYTSQVYKAPEVLNALWIDLDDSNMEQTLSAAHRMAKTFQLPFNFTFYGHSVGKVTIGSGGFLYMSDFMHRWITATQYIAPLMANFDPVIGGYQSLILYKSFDSKFVVEWRNVFLPEQNLTEDEPFTFQCILHQNGTIVFLYKKVPIQITEISSTEHPVKVGISDAFYIDTNVSGIVKRTIYEYHRVALNQSLVQDGNVVVLLPLPTCNMATDCETCITLTTEFNCRWCPIIKRCSDGVDRHREEWLSECTNMTVSDYCPSSTTSSVVPTERSTPTLYGNETTYSNAINVTTKTHNGTTDIPSFYNMSTESFSNVTTQLPYNSTTELSSDAPVTYLTTKLNESSNPTYDSTTKHAYNSTSSPAYNYTTEPAYSTSSLAYNVTTEPANGTPSLVYNGTEPSFGTSSPAYNSTTEPANGTSSPAYNKTKPAYGTSSPAYNATIEPTIEKTTKSFQNITAEASYNSTSEPFSTDTTESLSNNTFSDSFSSSLNVTTQPSDHVTFSQRSESKSTATTQISSSATNLSSSYYPTSQEQDAGSSTPKYVIIAVVVAVVGIAALAAVGGWLCLKKRSSMPCMNSSSMDKFILTEMNTY